MVVKGNLRERQNLLVQGDGRLAQITEQDYASENRSQELSHRDEPLAWQVEYKEDGREQSKS